MSVRIETTCRAITAYGGAELLRRTAEVVGLAGAIEAYVSVKHRARGLSEAQFVTGVAESIALGARCLDDLAVARGDGAQEQLRASASLHPRLPEPGCAASPSATCAS